MSRSGFTSKQVAIEGAVGASVTDQPISENFAIRGSFLTAFLIDIEVGSVTVAAGITAKLQVRQSGNQDWIDSKTVDIDGDGTFTISLLDTVTADQEFLPLRPVGRVVVTTGAGDAVTVNKIYVLDSSSF